MLHHIKILTWIVPGGAGSAKAAAVIGIVSGFLALISPDHVCALVSLTAACTPRAAFMTGGTWGLAHCLGTVIVCIIFYSLKSSMRINMEKFEYVGDYIVGVLLVLCGVYFLCRESKYIVQREDGSIEVDGCVCHATPFQTAAEDEPKSSAPRSASTPIKERAVEANSYTPVPASKFPRRFKSPAGTPRSRSPRFQLAKSYGSNSQECKDPANCLDPECGPSHFPKPADREPLVDRWRVGQRGSNTYDNQLSSSSLPIARLGAHDGTRIVGATLVGLLQGLCCPAVIVSLDFFSIYVDTHFTFGTFVLFYAMTCTLGTASLALAWVHLVRSRLRNYTSPLIVYRTSCMVTLIFGVLWCFGNYYNWLEMLESHHWSHALVATSGSHHH